MNIRHALASDAAVVFGLVEDLARYEREPDAVVCTAADFEAELASETPAFRCLLCEEAGEALGFALYFFNYSTWRGRPGLYLEDLFVRPEARRRGAGKRLLAELARIALARRCARMEWSVLGWNELAIDFYRSLGAAPVEGWMLFRLTGPALEALAERHP